MGRFFHVVWRVSEVTRSTGLAKYLNQMWLLRRDFKFAQYPFSIAGGIFGSVIKIIRHTCNIGQPHIRGGEHFLFSLRISPGVFLILRYVLWGVSREGITYAFRRLVG